MVKSKFSFYTCFTYLFVIIFLALTIFLFSRYYTDTRAGKERLSSYLFGSIFFLFSSTIVFIIIARLAVKIKIGQQDISLNGFFKRRIVTVDKINSIDLFAKEDLYWTTGSTTIVIRINLANGKKIIIADPLYRNIAVIKQCLYENFKEKVLSFRTINPNTPNQTNLETHFEKFAGNPVINLNAIALLSIIISFSAVLFSEGTLKWSHLAFLFMTIVAFFGLGSQLNYFMLSNKRLLVKNHFLFWISKSYNIDEIIGVDFENPHKRSSALRVTTDNFKSKLYSAGSLRNKDWNVLREKLKSLNIRFIE